VAPPSSRTEQSSFIAGVDEAGYGPRLGPLVVTLSAFRKGSQSIEATLDGVVQKKTAIDGARVAVDDSKKIFRGRVGFDQLEKTALSFWFAARGGWPATLGELLDGVSTDDLDLASCPWYGPDPAALRLPLIVSPDLIATSGALIAHTLANHGAAFLGFRSEVAPAPRFNSGVDAWKNKAAYLADLVLRTVHNSVSSEIGRPALILVDKLGGRNHYAQLLAARFGDDILSIREEQRARSVYLLKTGGEEIEVRFERSADERHLPVALSSIFCKYIREIFMTLFNRFWTAIIPGLRPTAGYPTDAGRFLSDVGQVATESGINPAAFTRIR